MRRHICATQSINTLNKRRFVNLFLITMMFTGIGYLIGSLELGLGIGLMIGLGYYFKVFDKE